MTTILSVGPGQCRTPITGSGSEITLCGKQTLPGRTCCAECHPRLYIRITRAALKEIEGAVAMTGRSQRFSVPAKD